MSDDCIFCKIVAGMIPSTKVYEDDGVLAFMDINPIIKGHVLVIPKAHYATLTDAPDDVLADCIAVVRRIAQAQISALGADGVNLHQAGGEAAGQEVGHLHFHVIPRYSTDGHSWNWKAKSYESTEEMAGEAEKLKREMRKSRREL